ncbi:MAG: diacylglycerol kinase family protein [Usitatibacter sp.]
MATLKAGSTRVILNPSAAAGRAAGQINSVRAMLDHAWPGIDWCESRSGAHLTELCAEAAAANYERVVVAGGDGTIHLAVRGLANTATQLGVIPLGTGNDFARAAGLPLETEVAAKHLIEGVARPVDLGAVNGIPFCCVAGIGMDTPALEFIHSLPFAKRNIVYQAAAVKTLLTYPGCELEVELNGATVRERVIFAAFSNTPTYAGGNPIAPTGSVFDGQLDYCLFAKRPKAALFKTFLEMRAGQHIGRDGVLSGVANKVRVSGPAPVAVTLDGELTDIRTPVEITLMPGAIQLIGATDAKRG